MGGDATPRRYGVVHMNSVPEPHRDGAPDLWARPDAPGGADGDAPPDADTRAERQPRGRSGGPTDGPADGAGHGPAGEGADAPTRPHGERLGPYRLLERIGEGGMGVVHLASDPGGRMVAIKVLRPHVAGDTVARRRLAREVETMRRVRDPHIAEIIDADVTCDTPYVVTRYVPGRTLDEAVAERGPLHGSALLRLAEGLARALTAIHAAGVVHRDLKPGNVMLVAGDPVLIDFGIAQAVDTTRLTQTGMFIGTPGYMAPEAIEGAAAEPAADVHAWAATVAYAATGRPPFGSGSYEAVFYRIAQGRPDLGGVPDHLLPVLRSALATDPRQRPAAAWLAERVATMEYQPVASAPPSPTRQLPRPPPPPPADRYSDLLPPVRYRESPRPAGPIGPPRPSGPPFPGYRPVLGLCLLVIAVGLTAVLPVVGVIAAVVAVVALRAADRAARVLGERRYGRPPSAGDAVMVALSTPWGLARGALATALLVPLVATVALAFGVVLAYAIRGGVTLNTVCAYAAAVFTGLLCAGPGSRAPRRQADRIVDFLARDRRSSAVTGAVLGTLAFFALAGALSQVAAWWPLSPPQVMVDSLASTARDGLVEWVRDLLRAV